jgi:DNA-binding NarL/FixJ family response regulator
MVHLGNGLSDGEIAGRLGICEQTVKNHVSRTMAKLGLGSRDEVGRLAAEHRLRLED